MVQQWMVALQYPFSWIMSSHETPFRPFVCRSPFGAEGGASRSPRTTLRSHPVQLSAEESATSESTEPQELPGFISNEGVSYWVHPTKASNIWLVGVVHGTKTGVQVRKKRSARHSVNPVSTLVLCYPLYKGVRHRRVPKDFHFLKHLVVRAALREDCVVRTAVDLERIFSVGALLYTYVSLYGSVYGAVMLF